MAMAIDAALHMSAQPGVARRQRVHNLLLVKARPMYGYYPDDHVFVKVIL